MNLQGPWHEHPVAVIDFETTGTDPTECAPVEIAIVRFEKGKAVEGWSQLLHPERPIPAAATAVHGITDADVANVRRCSELEQLLKENASRLLQDAIPCGYNGQRFDRVLLHRHVPPTAALPATMPEISWLDPLVAVRHIDKYIRGKNRHTLSETCKRHRIPLPNAHRALADAEATGLLLFNSPSIRRLLGDLPIEVVLEAQRERAVEQDRAFKAWLTTQPGSRNG